ncbi:CBS domain-containing protein [Halosimplex litoreum]|uniref:CBS domain-containing protein n=1 Tax=Halosimplex litoreum TaxID=1198301 RepID=A0A7T3FZU6_9EURY|nr:CBS domain-containing protein [Halosimplex litoreum]QPV63768.1 CBS domain-containing protein [Halosimplex litoreum]
MLRPPAVTELMERSETVPPDERALTVARRLDEPGAESVVVVENGEVVGIVTESDAVALLVEGRDPASLTAAAVMSSPVHTVGPDESVVDAAERLRTYGVEALPVVDDGELLGVVTTTRCSQYLPHVRRPSVDADVNDGRVRETERADTAYEKADWSFEYVGHPERIDVGDVVRFSKPLDETEVDDFADASGDTNRLHLDGEYARRTRFGRRIAHGTLVAGVVSAALARLPGLIVYLSQEVSYLGPVDIGDRVTAECEVVEVVGEERYRLTTTVTDDDDRTVIDGEAVVLADPIPETA